MGIVLNITESPIQITLQNDVIGITLNPQVINISLAGVGPQGPAGPSGSESGVIVTSGSTYTVESSPGSPFNVIVRKGTGSPTDIILPAPNASTPWSRVYVKDGKGDAETHNITVTTESGLVDGASAYVMSTNYEGLSFVDDGTAWNIE